VLIAILVDRRAVTFRTLAVAAMIVLTLAPEALVHPSFQMLGLFDPTAPIWRESPLIY
jgi:predicted membrane metal-binding protein